VHAAQQVAVRRAGEEHARVLGRNRRDLSGHRVDDLGHGFLGLDLVAEFFQEDQHAGVGREQWFDRFQRRRCAHRRGQRRDRQVEHAISRQILQQGLGIRLGQVVAHVVLAAQFHRDRHAGRRNRDLGAEVLGQVPPQATAGFIEGLAARFARQQQGVRAHQVRQRLHRFGQRFAGIHVQHRFVIAMQVEHDVGVDRHRQQDFLEQAGAGVRLPAFQRGERMRADQGDVGLGILAQLAFERLLEVGRDVFIGAIEIHAGRQIVAAEGRAVNRLRQADRVGGRHQDDLSLDPALGIEPVQFLAQEMGDQHGRHLIGMQRGLDVDLLAASGPAVVERGQLKGGDVVFDRDRVFGRMHG
jgi:hypothetical protein